MGIARVAGRLVRPLMAAAFVTGIAASGARAADCRADFADVAEVRPAGPVRLSCTDHCRIAPVPDPTAGAFRTTALAAAGDRLWIRYRSPGGLTVRLDREEPSAEAAQVRLPPSGDRRWEVVEPPAPVPAGADPRPLVVASHLGQGDEIECVVAADPQAPPPGVVEIVDVGPVWTGSRPPFDAVSAGATTYVGYYDAERRLSVAAFDRTTGRLDHVRLPERFAGWDTHNAVRLAVDDEGNLHVSGNMHVSRLVYYRTTVPGDLRTLTRAPMIGADEDRVTYPTFLERSDGRLLFLYRDGIAGDGYWVVDLYEGGGRWRRLLDAPLFAAADGKGPVSAYPSEFVAFPDGTIRVAVMWRRGLDVATNFRVTHHATRDFVSWRRIDGGSDSLPLGPASGDLVDDAGEDAGLINTHHLAASPDGRSVVTFLKYGTNGANAAFLATEDGSRWTARPVYTAPKRFVVDNASIAHGTPGVGPAVFPPDGPPYVTVGVPGLDFVVRADLDRRTLEPTGVLRPAQFLLSARTFGPAPAGLVSPNFILTNVRARGGGATASWLVRRAQGINGDVPRRCTADAPKACDPPPDMLRLVTLR